jgi:hypothetical protein
LKKVFSIGLATLVLCLLFSSLFSVSKEWRRFYCRRLLLLSV